MEKKVEKILKILLISSVTFSLFSGPNEDLLAAAIAGDSAGVEAALDAGANINSVNIHGSTALILAAFEGHRDIVRLLLDRGADINTINIHGSTVLFYAARSGLTDIVQLLLDRGMNIDQTNNGGFTPIMSAAQQGHTDTVRLLLDRGANINHVNQDGNTTLRAAKRTGHTEIVKIFEETLEIKQLIDNAIQGDSSSHQKLIEKLKDLNINSYEFNLILNQLINKIKTNKINKFSLLLLLDLAQHIALYLQSLGPDVIELPYEMLELILKRDILSNTDFNFEFEIAHDESGKPITENLIGLVKAFRFPQKVAAFRTRLKEQPVIKTRLEKPAIKTRKEKQSCQLM